MAIKKAASTGDEAAFRAALEAAAGAVGGVLEAHCVQKMWQHFLLVVEANRRVNLTRITNPAEAAVKHYADSLTLLACPNVRPTESCNLLDVGTGAGFPAVPLAIACPAWRIIAIDATAKKVRFVQEAVARLGLTNIQVFHGRAADWKPGQPDRFDRVVLRAVTKIAPGLAEVLRLVRPGGEIVFYKTARIEPAEIETGRRAARQYGLEELPPVAVELPAGPEGPLHRRLLRYRRKPDRLRSNP